MNTQKNTKAAHQPANEFSLLLTSLQLPFLKRAKGKIPLLPPKRSVWLCLQWSKQFILGLIKNKENAKEYKIKQTGDEKEKNKSFLNLRTQGFKYLHKTWMQSIPLPEM